MSTREFLTKLFLPAPTEPPLPVRSGLYHYMRSAGQETYAEGAYTRFHLRVEPDGYGLLLANASAAAHLSPSGVVIAKGLLEDCSETEIMEQLQAAFQGASRAAMQTDLERVAGLIAGLVAPGDNYPVLNLEDAALSPYEARLMAPLQADVMMAPPDQLLQILDKLWDVGFPHVTFMAYPLDDPTHLIRAVEHAEDLGMIAGIRVRASDLDVPSALEALAMAGLDHCNVPLGSAEGGLHDRLYGSGDHARALNLFEELHKNEVAPVVEVPLLENSVDSLQPLLNLLLDNSLTNVNFLSIVATNDTPEQDRSGSLAAAALPQVADIVEETAAEMDVRFIWQPPVLRDPTLTLSDQLRLGPRCTSDVSVRILPNGDVIPPRGSSASAGNMLHDQWTDIWSNEAFMRFRERVERPTLCEECPGLLICAADCPREPAGWSHGLGGTV